MVNSPHKMFKDLKLVNSYAELEKSAPNFQEAYASLQEITSLMSGSDISLENSMIYYKAAKLLHKYCNEILEKAKLEIEEIEQ